MTDDLQILRRFVHALVERERMLLLSKVVLQALLVAGGLLVLAVLAAAGGWDRPQAAFAAVLFGGVGAWFAVFWPLLRDWRASGDPLRQARRVEEQAPELRGRLITAVERVDGARGAESPAMLALVARRASAIVGRVAVASIHPARNVARLALVVAAIYAAVVVVTVLTPGGAGGVLRWWTAGTSAEAAVAQLTVQAREDYARVGDLVLRYTYPSYTGLDPKEIPNSTGDVTGPPGTVVEVTARTGDPVQAAGLVAYDERLEAVVAEDGRQIVGRFSIGEADGAYHLLLYRGGEPERSRDFTVTVEQDLAPEVMVDAPEVVEIPVDGTLDLEWRARDDYGVSRVKVQVAGVEQPEPLFVADRRQAEAFGRHATSPRRLGLKPGDDVELVVGAWDNDTVSGSKVGYSRPIRLVVLGARGLDTRIALREAELIEVLVPILAAHLTDPWPPGDTADAMARWGEQVGRRYDPLHEAVEELWQGMSTDTHDSAVIRSVIDSGSKLVRFTQVSYTPGSKERPSDESFVATAELREQAVTRVEDALLYLAQMQQARALRQVAEQAQDLARAAEQLDELLKQENPDVQEMLAQLDQLERMMRRLTEQAAKLAEGGLQEYVNQRTSELQRLMDEVRAALAAGDIARARELMQRLQRQIEEMAQGIQSELERRIQEGDQTGQEIRALRDELKALEEEQRQLQSEVRELRERGERQGDGEAQRLWQRLETLAGEVVAEGDAYHDALEGAEGGGVAAFLFNEQQRAGAAVGDSKALHEAIVARDLRGARSSVVDADNGWLYTLRAAETRRARSGAGPAPRQVEQIRGKLSQIERLLDQLDRASQNVDPSTRRQAQQLEDRQRGLEQRMQEAGEKARELSRQMPVRPEGMDEALDDAGERMQQASEDLGRGQPMQAEGSQGMAAERLREAQESLDRALEQMQQQQQQMKGGQQQDQGGQQQQDGDGTQNDPFTQMEIPGREEFRTPEEYRRALLEGMEGEVPEEYRALKKRYYEELVHQ